MSRSRLRRPAWRRLLAATAVLALAAGLAGPGTAQAQTYESLAGTGSTWSANALTQWARDVEPRGIRVEYSGTGSSAGRSAFKLGQNDFGVSEIPYGDTNADGSVDAPPTRPFAYLPFVAGGTALSYQLQIGGQRVTNLRLSGETVAKIFTNQITNWNDPAIAADNNGRAFPSLTIRPVTRADGSGTTAQFTAYLDAISPGTWRPFNNGRAGRTSNFPTQRPQVAVNGSDQVMNTITAASGNGTIGYIEYSYATNAGYPVAKLLNAGGYYTEPTDRNVAVALTAATINADLTQELGRVYSNPDPRTYPMSSYSYLIIPTSGTDARMNTNKAQTMADFISYSICEGQSRAGGLGYSPLPLNLVQAGFSQVAKLQAAFPAVSLANSDLARCNNPTFDGANPNRNRLAEEAPQPASCDQVGQGPCTAGTGGDAGNPNPPGNSGNVVPENTGAAGGAAAGGAAAGAGGGAAADPAAGGGVVDANGDGVADVAAATVDADGDGVPDAAAIDPETGLAVGAGGGSGTALIGTPTELAANRSNGMTPTLGVLAAVELVLLLLVPALIARSITRRRLLRDAA